MARRALTSLLLSVVLLGTIATAAAGYETTGPVEERYGVAGPWQVTQVTSDEECDREENLCTVFHPVELGQDLGGSGTGVFRHPIIVWANGSGMQPENYDHLLAHLASWGFVVVASHDSATHSGDTAVDALAWLRTRAEEPDAEFHGLLDVDRVGVAGHSQGGATTMALLIQQAEPFSAYVAIHPAPSFITPIMGDFLVTRTRNDLEQAEQGAILYLQSVDDGGAQDTERYYYHTPDTVTKAFGVVAQAKHDDVMGDPECRNPDNCITGAYAYLGHPTAWFLWHLRDDEFAGSAFDRGGGEWHHDDVDWNRRASNIGTAAPGIPLDQPCDGEHVVTTDGAVLPWTSRETYEIPTTFTLDLSGSGAGSARVAALLEWTLPTSDYDLFVNGDGPWETSVLMGGSTSESVTTASMVHCETFDLVVDNFLSTADVESLTVTLDVALEAAEANPAAVPVATDTPQASAQGEEPATSPPPTTTGAPDAATDGSETMPATGGGAPAAIAIAAAVAAHRRRRLTQ